MIQGLILHSVSYAGLWGQVRLSLDEFLHKAAALGFDGVEIMAKRPHLSPLDFGPKDRTRLRKLLDKLKLRHVVVGGYTNLTADLDHAEIPHREIQTLYINELAHLAKDIGAKSVRLFTGYDHPAGDHTKQWRLIVDTLRECAQRAAGHGIILGVQNHHDIAVGYESMADLIRTVNDPHCRAMFDAWAPALQGENVSEAARAMAPLSIHTTVADYQLRPRYSYQPDLINYEKRTPNVIAVPMGEGFIDYKAFFKGLLKKGFEGTVAYEMCSPLADGGDLETLDRYARRFLEWMQPFLVHEESGN